MTGWFRQPIRALREYPSLPASMNELQETLQQQPHFSQFGKDIDIGNRSEIDTKSPSITDFAQLNDQAAELDDSLADSNLELAFR